MNKIPFFLRLDDIAEPDPRMEQIVEETIKGQVPLLLSVVPATMTLEVVKWLLQKQQAFPNLLEIGQHGYRHINHLKKGQRGEFGKTRSQQLQHRDLKAGKRLMDEAFGKQWSHIFVPPYNCYTRNTVRLLAAFGYRGVSAYHLPAQTPWDLLRALRDTFQYLLGGNVPFHHNLYAMEGRLPCVSPALDATKDYAQKIPLSEKELIRKTERILLAGISVLGIMVHHWVYRTAQEVDSVIKGIGKIISKDVFEPTLPGSLMDRIASGKQGQFQKPGKE